MAFTVIAMVAIREFAKAIEFTVTTATMLANEIVAVTKAVIIVKIYTFLGFFAVRSKIIIMKNCFVDSDFRALI